MQKPVPEKTTPQKSEEEIAKFPSYHHSESLGPAKVGKKDELLSDPKEDSSPERMQPTSSPIPKKDEPMVSPKGIGECPPEGHNEHSPKGKEQGAGMFLKGKDGLDVDTPSSTNPTQTSFQKASTDETEDADKHVSFADMALKQARDKDLSLGLQRRVSVINMYQNNNIIKVELDLMAKHPTVAKLDHVSIYRQNPNFIPLNSPMMASSVYHSVAGGQGFIPANAFVYPLSLVRKYVTEGPGKSHPDLHFIQGGPRKQLYFNPHKVVACVVTCGGLCPGLNVVIREVTNTLEKNYGITRIYGIQYGYRGFYTYNWIDLSSKSTKYIHKVGGTILGSSRGGFDIKKIMKKIKQNKVNQIYIIGGDGTLKGAAEIYNYCRENELDISVIGLPKTIDNDIKIIDRSFGYQTAVEEALKAINSAETEAMSAEYGIGLVKLMGRSAGHIALEACLSQRGVNILLIPEVKFEVFSEKGLLNFVYQRLVEKHHCVMVVAEGASEAVIDGQFENLGTDASGNKKYPDIGIWLRDHIIKFCKGKGMDVTLKYIDPTYMIRTTASNAFDTQICAELAYNAVHGAMAGFSGFCSAMVNNQNVYIPLDMLKQGNKRIKQKSRKWQRLLGSTGQPSFLSDEEKVMKGKYEEMLE